MTDSLLKYTESLGEIRKAEKMPLSCISTFRTGGPADTVVFPRSRWEAVRCVRNAVQYGIRYIVIGNGSNVLFDDAGYRGAVICTSGLSEISFSRDGIVTAECGVPLTALSSRAAEAGLSGLEFAYGIPGFVGGAVFMNAGAYGGSISDVLSGSDYYDAESDTVVHIAAEEHGFGYRKSVYSENPGRLILGAEFILTRDDPDAVRGRCSANMESRRTKQPLEFPSAGSVFKRPEGHFAGKLIEDSGLKGTSVGGAEVSRKHAGFIINRGGATSSDVLELISLIQEKVRRDTGIELECEVRYIGERE